MSFENIGRFKGTSISLPAGYPAVKSDSRFHIQRPEMVLDQPGDRRSSARMAIPVLSVALWLLIGFAAISIYLMA